MPSLFMHWQSVSYLLRSSISRRILEVLSGSDRPLTPKEIASSGKMSPSNISTRLIELKKFGLVECINPDDRKWRFYQITKDGGNTLKETNKINSAGKD